MDSLRLLPGFLENAIISGGIVVMLNVLLTFLSTVYAERAPLQDAYQQLELQQNELLAKKRRNPRLQDFEVLNRSLNEAIQNAKDKLDHHWELFNRNCIPILEQYVQRIPEGAQRFTAEFAIAASLMARRKEDLSMVNINGFTASYATVRGDGACFFRAFLTALAYQLIGVVLPYDLEEMHEWILRLKFLMCDHIREIVQGNPQFERDLMKIPANGTIRSLEHYFQIFIRPAYQGTNYDCKILADMFGKPIHVIRQYQSSHETHQSFLQGEILTTEAGHINILYQPRHFVAIISIYQCDLSSAFVPGS